jgi:hypothetical protein
LNEIYNWACLCSFISTVKMLVKINKYIFFILLVILLIELTGCSVVLSSFYGMKACKPRNTECIKKYAHKYKIPEQSLFLLDTSYLSFIDSVRLKEPLHAKNHFQPLQALYFDASGRMISLHNNCNAGGFPNLKWNRDKILESFVPSSQTELDSLMNFQDQLDFLRTINGGTIILSDYDTASYNVVVYWNVFMGRQSKRLIRFVKENCELAEEDSVKLWFANDDDFFQYFDK